MTRRSSGWLAGALGEAGAAAARVAGRLAQPLRYGENPHQAAAFYRDGSAPARASPPRASSRARR